MKNRSFIERAGFAFAGWRAAWRRERSFRTQGVFAALALVALLVLRPAAIWWAIVALTSALILALELVNSAVEALTDRLHPEIHPEIKFIKDALAGAVLMVSVGAIAIGIALVCDSAGAGLIGGTGS